MSRPPTEPAARPNSAFRPPHCPNRKCPFFLPSLHWSFRKTGSFLRPSDQARFPTFQCCHCRRNFSSRTFQPSYWLRQRRLFPVIAQLSVQGPGLRQIARFLHLSHPTVARHLARAGRHALLLHARLLRDHTLDEPLVIDGFETFEFSQFFPCHFNLAAGSRSWLLYHFNDSPLRRKGRLTPRQRSRRTELEAALGRPDPRAVETGIYQLLHRLVPPASKNHCPSLDLHSDDHPAYRRALRRLRQRHPRLRLQHQVTSALERRTTSNPLFPVNLADLLLRHCSANHRRETIAFSKRRQAAAERLALFLVWRNLIKSRREKKPGRTAAMEAGLADRPWSWQRVFRRRLFVRKKELPLEWWRYYWRRVKTPVLGRRQSQHKLKYAF